MKLDYIITVVTNPLECWWPQMMVDHLRSKQIKIITTTFIYKVI